DIQLDAPMGGLPAGAHHLDGTQALAFVRDRSGSDDFARMQRAQVLLSSAFRKFINPTHWPNLPRFVLSLTQVIDTNIPFWQWPRLLLALARAFIFGIDSQAITRDMVHPFQTSQGAQVLAPDWEAIRPMLEEMFGR
ncbi:MAG TPA: LCP family protein, partial [Anaerolineales bacterium]|nr:LCP family protein [Anaerolineales bacterium]